MDSRRLRERLKQPGHDRTFVESEANFIEALKRILEPDEFRITEKPRDLTKIFGGRFGVVPEASITYLPTGRKMYFEVKKQGKAGNADERACKHHTVQFYKTLANHTGYDYHAYATIFCESLATLDRYTLKHRYIFEPDHYFLWVDYKLQPLAEFLERITELYLAPKKVSKRTLPK